MTYQRTLKVGDLITIRKSKTVRLVVRSEHVISEDRTRGDSYSVDEIDTVDLNGAGYWNPKVASYYFEGGSMRGTGKMISDADIKVVGTTKTKKVESVTYDVSGIKYFA